ncbi:hypothetical protein BDY19DRAFT_961633 [Irpex rosettiformis]|uniref:Uncharacterized protein n=1 Tax=Irpex rosettiformis TaxID=378272 RepID=A0ACB8TWD3_9APHY|nr:hypothetical protein BDY19DRAFT_961633 [Irpex rosettiformis]
MDSLSIENFIGPCFLLTWLSFILYGLVLAQVYFYFTTYQDHIVTQLTVVLIWFAYQGIWWLKLNFFAFSILETLHVMVCMHMIYTYLIVDFANPQKILRTIWSAGAAIYLELIISGSVELYYVWRIWRLRRSCPICLYLIVVLCTRLAVGFRATAFIYTEGTWSALIVSTSYRRFASATFGISVLMDVSITAAFLLSLGQSHRLAFTRNTKNIVHKLINYVLSAGIFTAMTSVTTLILFVVFKVEVHFAGILMLQAKVYANSMLAMLNIRQGINRTRPSNDNFPLQLCNVSNPISSLPSRTKVHVIHDTITTSDTWVTERKTAIIKSDITTSRPETTLTVSPQYECRRYKCVGEDTS